MPAYSFKKRFVPNIRAGLGLIGIMEGKVEIPCEFVIDDGSTVARPFDPMRDLDPPVRPKRQTIRAEGKRRHARPGETVQLYCAMRTKQCFKIGEARCVSVDPITIGVRKSKLEIMRFKPNPIGLDAFARADGFADIGEMHAFWVKEHGLGLFKGVLIRWEPMP